MVLLLRMIQPLLTRIQVLAFVVQQLPLCSSLLSCNGTPPGPPGFPLAGFSPLVGQYPWVTYDQLRAEYPQLLGINLGELVVILQDYETLEAAFVEQGDKFNGRPSAFVTDYFSTGRDGKVHSILGIEGQKWQQTRAFIYDHLQTRLGEEDLDNVIIDQANNVVRAIKMESGSVNPDDYFYSANVNIMSYVLFGRTLEFRGTEYRALTKTLTGAQIALAGSPLQSCPLLRNIPDSIFERLWDDVVYTVDVERLLFEKELERHERTYSPDKVRDFTDAYLRHVKGGGTEYPMAFQNSDDYITSSLPMWSAGGVAPNIGNLWGFLYMAAYPDVQKRVHDELDRVIGRDRPVHSLDRERLPYTWATMYEFLRLGGDAPLGTPRATVDDTSLNGYCIPNRTTILANIYSVNRNPKYWKDPMVFNPERFIGEDGKVSVPPQFVIWSVGPLACPGKQLANLMVFTLFANILQQAEVRTISGKPLPPFDQYQPGISNKPLPYEISFILRS